MDCEVVTTFPSIRAFFLIGKCLIPTGVGDLKTPETAACVISTHVERLLMQQAEGW